MVLEQGLALKYLSALGHYIPELVACLTMFGLILIESAYGNREKGRLIFNLYAWFGMLVVLIMLFLQTGRPPTVIFTNSAIIDPFATFIKIIMVLGTMGCIYLGGQSSRLEKSFLSEFVILMVGVLIGGMLLVSAANMLILYIGIETLSILSYVMASLRKKDEISSEAGLKYSLYGGITAAIMLFGMGHIYGITGSIHFSEIASQMNNLNNTQLAILLPSFVLFFAGIGYKIASVPFHMWSPDVYEGSPIPVTAFFSIVPKIAGIAAVLRISMIFFGTEGIVQTSWAGLLVVISALTMIVGNVSAINQKSVKRMLAYSSIGHAGVMLMGAVVINDGGVKAVIFYGITYLFMTLVAFYVLSFATDEYENEDFEHFNGLFSKYPIVAIALSIVMFSLAGIPPFSGFVAKFNILSIIIYEKQYTLAVIAVISSVISLYYYLKIVRLMFFRPLESHDKLKRLGYVNQGIIIALTIPVVLLGIFWSSLIEWVGEAKMFIQ